MTERWGVQFLMLFFKAAGMSVEKAGTIDSIPTRDEVKERMANSD